MSFDVALIAESIPEMLEGLGLTLQLLALPFRLLLELVHAPLQRGQESVFTIERERNLGNQDEVRLLTRDRRARRDETGRAPHQLHQAHTVWSPGRLDVGAHEHLARDFERGHIAKAQLDVGNVVVDRLGDPHD